MRKGFPSLALQVQEVLRRDLLSGHLFCFRGRRGDLLKVIWHHGQGACLFTKRLERGRFIWPSPADGVVTISAAQLGYLLSGIDWRHPQETWSELGGLRFLLADGDGCDSIVLVMPAPESLPSDLAAAHAMIVAERQARLVAEAEADGAQVDLSSSTALIAHLKLEIEKLRRTLYGARSERTVRLLDQLELQLRPVMGGGMGHGVASDEAIFALDANMVLVVEHRPGARGGRKPLIRRRDLIANLAQIWESLDRRVTTSQHSDFAAFCELVCEGIGWPTEGLVSALPDAVRHWRNLPGKIHR